MRNIREVAKLRQIQAVVIWVEGGVAYAGVAKDVAGFNALIRTDIHYIRLVSQNRGSLINPFHAIVAAITVNGRSGAAEAHPCVRVVRRLSWATPARGLARSCQTFV